MSTIPSRSTISSHYATKNTYQTEYRNERSSNDGGLRGKIKRCINFIGQPDSLFANGLGSVCVGAVVSMCGLPVLGAVMGGVGLVCMGIALYKRYAPPSKQEQPQYPQRQHARVGHHHSNHYYGSHDHGSRHHEHTRSHRSENYSRPRSERVSRFSYVNPNYNSDRPMRRCYV